MINQAPPALLPASPHTGTAPTLTPASPCPAAVPSSRYWYRRYARQLGAFINLESTGPWGPDVLFQHTGDWTLQVQARAACLAVNTGSLHRQLQHWQL